MLLCEYPYTTSICLYEKLMNPRTVCPSCSNLLTITPIPADHLPMSEQQFAGMNRFECRTCPYQMILDKRYFERKRMKNKEVEDVLGGADSWKNVDKTESEWLDAGKEHVGIVWSCADLCQTTAATRGVRVAKPTFGRSRFGVRTNP